MSEAMRPNFTTHFAPSLTMKIFSNPVIMCESQVFRYPGIYVITYIPKNRWFGEHPSKTNLQKPQLQPKDDKSQQSTTTTSTAQTTVFFM